MKRKSTPPVAATQPEPEAVRTPRKTWLRRGKSAGNAMTNAAANLVANVGATAFRRLRIRRGDP